IIFFSLYAAHPDLHSFPTRRSSDLRIPYILLGTTMPSRPRFTVMTWASAAASTDGILFAGKNSRKRILLEPAAAASIWERCAPRSEEHTSELQSRSDLVCRLLLEKK